MAEAFDHCQPVSPVLIHDKWKMSVAENVPWSAHFLHASAGSDKGLLLPSTR